MMNQAFWNVTACQLACTDWSYKGS